MKKTIGCAIAATLLSPTLVRAESPTPRLGAELIPASYSVPVPTERVTLPGNSVIRLAADGQFSSSALRTGEHFSLKVAENVMAGDTVVIPAGAHADAVVSWRTGRGSLGKSGKMEFDLVSIDFAGRTIPVTGHYRVEGKGETIGVIAALAFAGWPGLFVTGHSAHIKSGAEFHAFTREAFAVTAPTATKTALSRGKRVARAAPAIYVQAYEGRSNGRDDTIEVPM